MMFRLLHIAILTASLVTCPLRCAAAVVDDGDGSKSKACACCGHCSSADGSESPASEKPAPDQDDRDCRCSCLCKGASLVERPTGEDDGDGAFPWAAAPSYSGSLECAEVGGESADEAARADARPAGRSLRFLIASLQI
jgi:hypothetical protein